MFNNRRYFVLYFIPLFLFLTTVLYAVILEVSHKEVKLTNGCSEITASFIKYKVLDNKRKITFCELHDKNIMNIVSDYFPSSEYVKFEYIGNPKGPKTALYLEDEQANRFKITHLIMRGDRWTSKTVKVPEHMKGNIRLVAEDNATGGNGWLGIGNILATNHSEVIKVPVYLKSMLLILMFALFISGIYGYFLKYNNSLDAFVYMSLFVGVSSLVVFYSSLVSVQVGQIISIVILIFVLINFYYFNKEQYKRISLLLLFLISTMTIVLFVAFSDFDDLSNIQRLSSYKWHALPVDNWIPKIFADRILDGFIPSPMLNTWLSSDRPPLQTGLYLLFSHVYHSDLTYLIISMGAQLLVIGFILRLLTHFIERRSYIFFVILFIFFNGFTFVHSLFVWPKLLSALYQGVAFYALYAIWSSKTLSKEKAILFGVSSAFAFLAHGGAIFYLLALSFMFLFVIRAKKDLLHLFYGLSAAIVVYLPWVYYQKFIDPPGDRMLKWHLANQIDVTDTSFVTLLLNYYSQLSFTEWISLKVSRFESVLHSLYFELNQLFVIPDIKFLSTIFTGQDFSYLFFSVLLIPLYFLARNTPESMKSLSKLLIISYVLYLVIWNLLLVSGAVIHHGSHFGWLTGFLGVTLIVYNFNNVLFYVLGLLNLLIFFKLYLFKFLFGEDIFSSMIVVGMIGSLMITLYYTITIPPGQENKVP